MVHQVQLIKSEHKDLILGALVDYNPKLTMEIVIRRFDDSEDKKVTITSGDKVEIVYIKGLTLQYAFGRVAQLFSSTGVLLLDVSEDMNTSVIKIPISNIRDIEIFDGTFKIYPDNNEVEEDGK